MSSHSGAGGECKVCVLEGSKLSLESESRGVSATSIVENNWLTGSWLGKSRGEVKSGTDTTELLAGLGTAMDNSRGGTPELQINQVKKIFKKWK